LKIKKWIK